MAEQKTRWDKLNKRAMPGFGLRGNAYRRHFEGYEEYMQVDEKGRQRVRRVYTGIYSTLDMEKRRLVLFQLFMILLWALQMAATGWISTRFLGANSCWYVVLPQCAIVIGLMWICAGLFNWVIAPARMTAGDRHSAFEGIKSGSLTAIIAYAVTACGTLLYTILNKQDVTGHLLAALAYLLLGGIAFYMNRRVSALRFIETQSESKVPDGVRPAGDTESPADA